MAKLNESEKEAIFTQLRDFMAGGKEKFAELERRVAELEKASLPQGETKEEGDEFAARIAGIEVPPETKL